MCAFVVQPLWSVRRGGEETGWRLEGGNRRSGRAHPELGLQLRTGLPRRGSCQEGHEAAQRGSYRQKTG